MKIGKVLITLTPLVLIAGAAWAANSGIAQLDGPMNTMGRVVAAGGYVAGAVGTIGVLHHIRSGTWLGMLEHLGLTVVGSDAVINYSAMAPNLGGVAAALVHGPATALMTHPAVPFAIHAVTRVMS